MSDDEYFKMLVLAALRATELAETLKQLADEGQRRREFADAIDETISVL